MILLRTSLHLAHPHIHTGRQLPSLKALAAHAKQCGVNDLSLLTREEALSFEPEVQGCEAALLSPSSGILDSHTYM